MDLNTIKMAVEYSSLGLYALGVLGFVFFSLSFLGTSFKHFLAGFLVSFVWPVFIAVALIRQSRADKKSPKYVQLRR